MTKTSYATFLYLMKFFRDSLKKENRRTNGLSVEVLSATLASVFLTYEIAGSYRYCHNIERHHKSNNVKFIVDIQHGSYFQMCHDENCKEFRYMP